MTRIKPYHYGETLFQRLLGHNQKLAADWSRLGRTLEEEGLLTNSLKEQVRRTLAQSNECAYCKAKGKPDYDLFDEKISVAVGFSEVFLAYSKGKVPNFAFEILSEHFSEGEISELCAFINFTTAQQYYGALMELTAEPKED